MKTERYIKLKSVGSWLDIKTGFIFPITKDDGMDTDCPVHLNDCEQEWLDSLQGFDWAIVGIWFKNNQKFGRK